MTEKVALSENPRVTDLVAAHAQNLAPAFSHPTYRVRRPWLSIFGRKYHIFAPDGSLVAFVKHPLFKMREQFTIFTDETETTPLIHMKSRQIVAINRCIDVFDAPTGEKVGTIRTRGLKSMIRDTWDILDQNDAVVGIMEEQGAALLRRFLKFLPGRHKIDIGGTTVATLRQPFRFFIKELQLDLSMAQGRIDSRFAMSCAVLALMAEARREQS